MKTANRVQKIIQWMLVTFALFLALLPIFRVIVDTGLIDKSNSWLILSWYILAGIFSVIINLLIAVLELLYKIIAGGK